jgi:hypothetical protein
MSDKPHGPVSERFMRHHYGAAMGVKRRVGLQRINVEGIWLRREPDHTVVLIERDGLWTEIIREPADGSYSHICEPSGIQSKQLEAKELLQRAAELLREPKSVFIAESEDGWYKRRDQWLKDSGF